MTFPLRLPHQLKQHLRALRKSLGLTQAQLGSRVGVKQARIAEIEAHPGAVSLGQLTQILAVLGGTLHVHLHSAEAAAPPEPRRAALEPGPRPTPGRKAVRAAKPALRAGVVIPPKKGAW